MYPYLNLSVYKNFQAQENKPLKTTCELENSLWQIITEAPPITNPLKNKPTKTFCGLKSNITW